MEAPGRLAFLVLLASLAFAVGLLVEFWWVRARARRGIPRDLALTSRRMANSREWQAWRWLLGVFPDQHIMIKLPVTRFTLPRIGVNSRHVYELLSGVYCTFTVCAPDGRVVGCIDVPGPKGFPEANRQLKLMLLSQCGIAYWVIRNGKLPDPAELRADLLGELPQHSAGREKTRAELDAAKQKLRAAVDQRRHQREARRMAGCEGPDSTPSESPHGSAFAPGQWQQPNSFLAPLEIA